MNERAIHNYFFDISGHFLRRLAQDTRRCQPLVRHLAFAIGRTLDVNVSVLWRPRPDGLGQEGARWTLEWEEETLTAKAVEDCVQAFRNSLACAAVKPGGDVALKELRAEGVKLLVIATGGDSGSGRRMIDLPRQLWILVESQEESRFLNHFPNWSVLYRMVLVYMEQRILTQSVHRAAEVEKLSIGSGEPASLLDRTLSLLSGETEALSTSSPDPHRTDQQLLEVLVQNLLASPLDEAPPRQWPEVRRALSKLEKRLLLPPREANIRPLLEILRYWLEPQRKTPPSLRKARRSQSDADLMARDWLARWTWFLRHPTAVTDGQLWQNWLAAAVTDLSHLLKHWSVAPQERRRLEQDPWQPGPTGARFVSLWLRLWFCQDLLRRDLVGEEFALRPLSAQRRRYQQDLAYTLRETLRAFVFGRRADYRPRPERIANALRTLVEHHAVGVARLPADIDVRGLLDAIGRAHPLGGWEFSSRHLQHVFEVYITGQFLSTLHVEGPPNPNGRPPELRALLAGGQTGGTLAENEFTRAFSLAALLHSVGRLLFPWWSRRAEELGNPDRGLREPLRQISVTLAGAASEFAERCHRELKEGGYFDGFEQQAITDWLDDKRRTASEADVALLGAWYVHRVASGTGLSNEVRRQAVRAVLLARVLTLKIDVQGDPVAALLVLCDELFSWSPRPGAGKALDSRRWLDDREAPSLANRFHALELSELHFSLQEELKGTERQHETLVGTLLGMRYNLPSFTIEAADPNRGLDDSPYSIWLGLRQNLGRIQANVLNRDAGAEPWIKIRSKESQTLAECHLTCRELLEEVAHRASSGLRTSLDAWLKEWEPRREDGYEECWIMPQEKPFAREEPTPWIEELERLARDVILKRQADAARQVSSRTARRAKK